MTCRMFGEREMGEGEKRKQSHNTQRMERKKEQRTHQRERKKDSKRETNKKSTRHKIQRGRPVFFIRLPRRVCNVPCVHVRPTIEKSGPHWNLPLPPTFPLDTPVSLETFSLSFDGETCFHSVSVAHESQFTLFNVRNECVGVSRHSNDSLPFSLWMAWIIQEEGREQCQLLGVWRIVVVKREKMQFYRENEELLVMPQWQFHFWF